MGFSYRNFIETKRIQHLDDVSNMLDALMQFYQTDSDVVSYNKTETLSLDILQKDDHGNSYVEYIFNRECDVIDSISVSSIINDFQLSFFIGGINYKDVKEFLFVSAKNHEFKMRITFTKNFNCEDIIMLSYRCYIIQSQYRKELMTNDVITDTHRYSNGSVSSIQPKTRLFC